MTGLTKSFAILVIIIISLAIGFFFCMFWHNFGTASDDITSKVEIYCNFGNKKTFMAKEAGINFYKEDFNSQGQYLGGEKNSQIQVVCGITNSEAKSLLERTNLGEEAPTLFMVELKK